MSYIIHLKDSTDIVTVQNERLARAICQNVFNIYGVKLGYTPENSPFNSFVQYRVSLDQAYQTKRISKQTIRDVHEFAHGFATCFEVM